MGCQHLAVNVISIFVVGYVARKLGETDYGVFSLAFTFPQFFTVIGNLGTRSITIREIAGNKDKGIDFLGSILPLRIVLLINMLLVVPVAAFVFGYTGEVLLVITLATASVVVDLLARVIYDVFQAYEKIGRLALRDVAVRLFTGILSVILLFQGYGLVTVCCIYLSGSLLGLIINLFVYNKQFPWPKISYDHDTAKRILRMSLPFALTGFISIVYMKIDIFMLSKIVGNAQVGIYNAAANLIYRLTFVADVIATAAFPAISQLYWTDRKNVYKIFNESLLRLIILSLPIAVGGVLLAEPIIDLIYGSEYTQSVIVLKVLICSVPFLFLNMLFCYSLGAIKKQKVVLYVSLILVVVNIGLNYFLIPILSVRGAASATLVTEILGVVLYGFIVGPIFKYRPSYRNYMALSVAVLVMIATYVLLNKTCLLIVFVMMSFSFIVVFSLLASEGYNLMKIISKANKT